MKKHLFSIALLILAGCQTRPPTKLWVTSVTTDQFTDVVTKMVTVGSFSSGGLTYTQAGKYYPFVGIKNGITYVGKVASCASQSA